MTIALLKEETEIKRNGKEDVTIILDDKIKKIYQLPRSKNKVDELYPACWFVIDEYDYFVKNEYLIHSIINELLGESFAKIANLKSAEYSIIRIMDKNILNKNYQSYEAEDEKIYNVVSKDFKEKNKKYYFINQLMKKEGNYKERIEMLRKYCINQKK